jgi:hypothetical protein
MKAHMKKKRCRGCKQLLDASSFYDSNQEPDGLQKLCRACVDQRRRERYATKKKKTGQEAPSRIQDLVRKGNITAVMQNKSLINASNRDYLLTLAVTDFKSAPKKPSHLALVKYLIESGARPDFHLVCAATVGPHVDIMNALIESGAEQNIFTAAALDDVDRVRELLTRMAANRWNVVGSFRTFPATWSRELRCCPTVFGIGRRCQRESRTHIVARVRTPGRYRWNKVVGRSRRQDRCERSGE